jgi:outer membrane lipoprotein-sorting protein
VRPRPSRSSGARARALGTLAAALALSGCATIAPAPAPTDPAALAALALVEAHGRTFRDLRARAEVTIDRGDRRDRLPGVLLLRAPASLRFEALAPFGAPFLVVAADRDAVVAWQVLEQRAWRLAPTPESTARWLGMAMGVEDLVTVLAGRVHLLEAPDAVVLAPPDATGPSLSLTSGDRRQQVWFDPASGRPRAVEWTGGQRAARVAFDPTPADPPTGLTLTTADGRLRVRVRYVDPAVNAGVDPERLRLSLPESVTVRDVP